MVHEASESVIMGWRFTHPPSTCSNRPPDDTYALLRRTETSSIEGTAIFSRTKVLCLMKPDAIQIPGIVLKRTPYTFTTRASHVSEGSITDIRIFKDGREIECIDVLFDGALLPISSTSVTPSKIIKGCICGILAQG
ncbi:hypothetical protein PM082_003608 [Marasmius tenuissimus]|nr:hypothetical protein PM082_003608 [Marasmius tenuissimus]